MEAEWIDTTLDDVCVKITDGAHHSPKSVESGRPMASVKDMTPFGINLESCRQICEGDFEKLIKQGCKPEVGDVLIAKDGNSALDTVCRIRKPLDAVLLSSVAILRPDKQKIESDFLRLYLDCETTRNYLKASAISGAAIPRVILKDFKRAKIRIPRLFEQRQLAKVVSTYDNLIENNNHRIAILNEMAQSLYREWFVKFRFPGHQQAKFIDSPLGKIPEGWEVSKIRGFGEVVTGKTPSKKNAEFYSTKDVPFLKTPDMHGNIFTVDIKDHLSLSGADSQKNKYIPAGSVSVACIGAKAGVATLVAEEVQTNQQINSVILANPKMQEYFYLFASGLTEKIQALGSSGATMTNVNKGKFESIELLKPSLDVIEPFHEVVLPMLNAILNLQRKNKNLNKQRNLILPKLISGTLALSTD